MGIVLPTTIAQWAYDAGWRGVTGDWTTAVAIAIAGGADPDKAGGPWRQTDAPANDGAKQAQHAHATWKTSGWQKFSEHQNKKYLLFVPAAGAATSTVAAKTGGEQVVENVTETVATAQDVASSGAAVLRWLTLPNTWIRIEKVIIGSLLVVAGITIIGGKAVIKPVAKAVGTVL